MPLPLSPGGCRAAEMPRQRKKFEQPVIDGGEPPAANPGLQTVAITQGRMRQHAKKRRGRIRPIGVTAVMTMMVMMVVRNCAGVAPDVGASSGFWA